MLLHVPFEPQSCFIHCTLQALKTTSIASFWPFPNPASKSDAVPALPLKSPQFQFATICFGCGRRRVRHVFAARAPPLALCLWRCLLLQLPPPEALHLNAPRKQDDIRPSGSEGHGPERRRSNSAIGMCVVRTLRSPVLSQTVFSGFRPAGARCLMR